MGEFVPVPNVGEFVVVQQQKGQNVLNVLHIRKEEPMDSAALAAMSVVIISAWNDHIANNQSNELQYILVRGRDLTEANGQVSEINFPPASGGNVNFTALPNQVAIPVSLKTGYAGKSFRGRLSFAGVTSGMILNDFVVDAFRTSIEAACEAMDAAILAAGGTWGVVSRYQGYTQVAPKYKKVPTPRPVGIFTDIINISCGLVVGSMDSRTPRHGQ